jgi:hypothetical protein
MLFLFLFFVLLAKKFGSKKVDLLKSVIAAQEKIEKETNTCSQ